MGDPVQEAGWIEKELAEFFLSVKGAAALPCFQVRACCMN